MESIKSYLRQPAILYALIFAILLAVHAFIFRDVLAAIPEILAGNVSIVREELVPFFNFGTQFWGDNTSALTSSEEVRVSYSFWTAWVRHDMILPFALVVLNAISAFILFYAFHRLGKHFYRKSLFGVVAALLAAFLIHMILLYAKVAHFYVLIIGFSMFALAASMFIEQLFFGRKLSKWNVLVVTLLILLNPAIHYHVIFYIVAAIVTVAHLIVTFVMNRKYFWKYVRRDFLYFGLITVLSLVPYVAYIALVTQPADVSTQIPVNYWMMYYASLSLPFIFSLDTAGHIDLIKYGNYFAPLPRFGTMIVTFLVASIFLYKRWRKLQPIYQVCLLTVFMLMLFAMWMTIGYSENSPYSFHMVLGNMALFFTSIGGTIGDALANMLQLLINILRFPHRFQFIYFYAAGVLLMVALVWLHDVLRRKMKPILATLLVVLIAIFPLLGSGDYRGALFSGDLARFATPYHIPDDLKNIKQQLAAQQDTKLFVLPTLESGREIMQDGKSYSFLDKYLIYYLNQPTLYYGVGANTENKVISYLAYRAIAYDEPWWQQILANTLGVTDIIVPQNLEPRSKGLTYMRGIEPKVDSSLAASTLYEKTYDGQDFALYSLKTPVKIGQSTMVNMNWRNMLKYFMDDDVRHEGRYYFPLQLRKFLESEGPKELATDSPERSFYDIYSLKSENVFVPRPVSLPFSPEYVASSNFTNNALSLSVLQSKTDQYNYLDEIVPSLANLQRPAFVGLAQGEVRLDVEMKVPSEGMYRVLLHGGSKADEIKATIDGQEVKLGKIADDRNQPYDYLDITYFYVDVELKAGSTTLSIENTDQAGIIVDSVTLMPKGDILEDFAAWLIPTDRKDVYEIRME